MVENKMSRINDSKDILIVYFGDLWILKGLQIKRKHNVIMRAQFGLRWRSTAFQTILCQLPYYGMRIKYINLGAFSSSRIVRNIVCIIYIEIQQC